MHKPEDIKLTAEEVEKLLEPIQDQGHCWGFKAQAIIQAEKERRCEILNGMIDDDPEG